VSCFVRSLAQAARAARSSGSGSPTWSRESSPARPPPIGNSTPRANRRRTIATPGPRRGQLSGDDSRRLVVAGVVHRAWPRKTYPSDVATPRRASWPAERLPRPHPPPPAPYLGRLPRAAGSAAAIASLATSCWKPRNQRPDAREPRPSPWAPERLARESSDRSAARRWSAGLGPSLGEQAHPRRCPAWNHRRKSSGFPELGVSRGAASRSGPNQPRRPARRRPRTGP